MMGRGETARPPAPYSGSAAGAAHVGRWGTCKDSPHFPVPQQPDATGFISPILGVCFRKGSKGRGCTFIKDMGEGR